MGECPWAIMVILGGRDYNLSLFSPETMTFPKNWYPKTMGFNTQK